MASDGDDNLWQRNDKIVQFTEEVAELGDRCSSPIWSKKCWRWPQPKLGKPNPPINSSGPPALSD